MILHCDIEQHAVLFALFSKEIFRCFTDKGEETVRKCVRAYAAERAGRMQKRCLANGDELNPPNYQAYNERSSKPGQMNSVPFQKEPEYIIHVHKCAWVDAWEKYDLLEYGKYYCLDVDRTLTRTFSKGKYEVNVKSLKSWGNEYCDFHWGFSMTDEVSAYITQRRSSLSEGSVLSYDYHTGHLWNVFERELLRTDPLKGTEIIDNVKGQFIEMFGRDCMNSFLEAFSPCDL